MQKSIAFIALAGLLGATGSAVSFAAEIEDQVLGPIADKAKFVVSPNGVHLATVAPKGSRMNVIVDGVAGPRFDEIIETAAGYIDPRPWVKVDINLQPRGGPVTFSQDGSRYAYIARLGQELVIMADNKEVMRLPSDGNIRDFRMEFSGAAGKHLLLGRAVYGGYEMWVDGQKWPGLFSSGDGGSEGRIDPIISPDGEHIAYLAQMSRDKRGLVVDGKEAGFFGVNLQFTPDGKHLLCVNQNPKGQAVLLDGKQLFAARQILGVFVPPVGNRLIFSLVHFNKEGTAAEGSFLLVDGKPVEATLTHELNVTRVLFSPDGKHYAAICGKTGAQFVVMDGKKGQEYFTIQVDDFANITPGIAFSPDSSKLAYIATMSGGAGQFVVINEEESDALGNPWFRFSADGKRVAYGGVIGQGGKGLVMVDGKPVPLPPGWIANSFTFSPEGKHYAFSAQQGGNKGIFLDGKNTEMSGDFAFSPDGNHLAVVGAKANEAKGGLFVDGQLVFETYTTPLLNRGFTPDGQHLFWMSREPAVGAKAAPGAWENVIYADGKAVVRFDSIMDGQGNVRTLYGPQIGSGWRMVPAWNVNAAGKLQFLGPLDDGIKRFVVTPPADTGIDTMVAAMKSGGAKGKGREDLAPTGRNRAATPGQNEQGQQGQQGQPGQPAAKKQAKAQSNATNGTPANPDPAADAAAAAKAQVDAAAAKTKAWLDSLTKKK